MIKVVWFLKKADQLSVEEFQRWWLDSHAPLIVAKQGELLRRYVINVRSNDELPAATGVACEWDGFAEEWFEAEEDASRAFSLPSSTETRADVMRHVSKMTRLVVTEHQVLYTDMRAPQ